MYKHIPSEGARRHLSSRASWQIAHDAQNVVATQSLQSS